MSFGRSASGSGFSIAFTSCRHPKLSTSEWHSRPFTSCITASLRYHVRRHIISTPEHAARLHNPASRDFQTTRRTVTTPPSHGNAPACNAQAFMHTAPSVPHKQGHMRCMSNQRADDGHQAMRLSYETICAMAAVTTESERTLRSKNRDCIAGESARPRRSNASRAARAVALPRYPGHPSRGPKAVCACHR